MESARDSEGAWCEISSRWRSALGCQLQWGMSFVNKIIMNRINAEIYTFSALNPGIWCKRDSGKIDLLSIDSPIPHIHVYIYIFTDFLYYCMELQSVCCLLQPPHELLLYNLESGRVKELIGHNTQVGSHLSLKCNWQWMKEFVDAFILCQSSHVETIDTVSNWDYMKIIVDAIHIWLLSHLEEIDQQCQHSGCWAGVSSE